jgi:hypothetical protein
VSTVTSTATVQSHFDAAIFEMVFEWLVISKVKSVVDLMESLMYMSNPVGVYCHQVYIISRKPSALCVAYSPMWSIFGERF